MYRKCNTLPAELLTFKQNTQKQFSEEKWRKFMNLGSEGYMLVKHIHKDIKFSPLFIISCPIYSPHHLLEAGIMNLVYSDTSKLIRISDKLRYYRHKKALLQRDVADYAGIERTTYSSYEEGSRVYYPKEVMEKIADILDVDLSSISDDYNMFLYKGQ